MVQSSSIHTDDRSNVIMKNQEQKRLPLGNLNSNQISTRNNIKNEESLNVHNSSIANNKKNVYKNKCSIDNKFIDHSHHRQFNSNKDKNIISFSNMESFLHG